MINRRTRLYRDKPNGKVLGVCAGIADYTDVDPSWVRLGAVMLMLLSGGWIVMLYFLAGFLLSDKPRQADADPREEQFWRQVRRSPRRSAREVRAALRALDRRLAGVESHYVSANPRLAAEIERLR